MQEWKVTSVNGREIPVLISDEKEALLAAKADGRAFIGLWRPGQEMDELSAARYIVESIDDVTDDFLERVARRYLGLPWTICETERLVIREMFADDFDEVWLYQIGRGFGSVEELEAYAKNQYAFYEFGFWALVSKDTGELVGVVGLTVPEEITDDEQDKIEVYMLTSQPETAGGKTENIQTNQSGTAGEKTESSRTGQPDSDREETGSASAENDEILELGYHIFHKFRRKGYAKEACEAVLRYGKEELGAGSFVARIDKENTPSRHLAAALGFDLVTVSKR